MDKEEKKKIRRKINVILILALVVVVAFLVLGMLSGFLNIGAFLAIIAVYLLAYWVVMNFVEPKLTGELIGITDAQKAARKKYVLLDLAGYIGLILFLVGMNLQGLESAGTMGLIMYAFSVSTKNRFRREFFKLGAEAKKQQQTRKVVRPPMEEPAESVETPEIPENMETPENMEIPENIDPEKSEEDQ